MKKNIKDIVIPISIILFFSIIVFVYLFFLKKESYVVDNDNKNETQTHEQVNNTVPQVEEIVENKEVVVNDVVDLNINDKIDLNTVVETKNDKKVTYKSSNTKVAEVDNSGTIIAKSVGQTTITVDNEEEKKEYIINVTKEEIKLRSISLNYKSYNMNMNDEVVLKTTFVPTNAAEDVTFTSSNTNVATVDNTGKVKAIKPGKTTIYATTTSNIKAECIINVRLTETPIISITDGINNKKIDANLVSHVSETFESLKTNNVKINISGNAKYYIYSNKTSQSEAMKDIANATKKLISEPITFDYSNGGIKVFYIWLVDDNNVKSTHFARIAITEKPVKVSSVSLSKTSTTINVNSTEKIVATVLPNDASNKNIRWETANDKIATVDNNGNIKGLREGIVIIRAISEDGDKIANITVNVKSSLFNTPRFFTMAIGEEKTISTKVSNLTWRTSNSNIVRVNNGVVTAKGAGITNVTAVAPNGIEEYIRIQVFDTNALGCAYDGIYMVCNNKPNTPTKNKSAAVKESDENTLDYILKQLNYNKRYAAVEAAKYLAYYYDRQVPYNMGQTFYTVAPLKRLNIYDSANCWGCDKTSAELAANSKDPKHGIQCSGFVSWALLNANVDLGNGVDLTKTTKYTSPYINATYLAGRKTPYQWLIDNNKKNLSSYEGNNDKTKIVSPNNIKAISSITSWNSLYNLIQPGDLVGYGTDNADGIDTDKGHIGIFVDKYESGGKKYIVIAHSARWPKVSGPQLTRYSDLDKFKYNWYLEEDNQYANIVLMDEKYK